MECGIEPYINLAGAIIKQAEEDYVMYLSKVMVGSQIREEQLVRMRREKKPKKKKLRGRGYVKDLTPKDKAISEIRYERGKTKSVEIYFEENLAKFWDFNISPDRLIEHAAGKAEKKALKGVRNMVKDIVNEELGIMTEEKIREIVEEVIEEKIKSIAKMIVKDQQMKIKDRLSGERKRRESRCQYTQ